jgi:hypothetical protein
VDEIQKLPLLLDRNRDLRVVLTGTSARKRSRSGES